MGPVGLRPHCRPRRVLHARHAASRDHEGQPAPSSPGCRCSSSGPDQHEGRRGSTTCSSSTCSRPSPTCSTSTSRGGSTAGRPTAQPRPANERRPFFSRAGHAMRLDGGAGPAADPRVRRSATSLPYRGDPMRAYRVGAVGRLDRPAGHVLAGSARRPGPVGRPGERRRPGRTWTSPANPLPVVRDRLAGRPEPDRRPQSSSPSTAWSPASAGCRPAATPASTPRCCRPLCCTTAGTTSTCTPSGRTDACPRSDVAGRS